MSATLACGVCTTENLEPARAFLDGLTKLTPNCAVCTARERDTHPTADQARSQLARVATASAAAMTRWDMADRLTSDLFALALDMSRRWTASDLDRDMLAQAARTARVILRAAHEAEALNAQWLARPLNTLEAVHA